jgi:hypothetical protein
MLLIHKRQLKPVLSYWIDICLNVLPDKAIDALDEAGSRVQY